MIPTNLWTDLHVVDRLVVQCECGTVQFRGNTDGQTEGGTGSATISILQQILTESQFNLVGEVIRQPHAGRVPFRIGLRDAIGKKGVGFAAVVELEVTVELVGELVGRDQLCAFAPVGSRAGTTQGYGRLFGPAVAQNSNGRIGVYRISEATHV